MSHPLPPNAPGLAPVRDTDGEQDGELRELPTYDESEAGR